MKLNLNLHLDYYAGRSNLLNKVTIQTSFILLLRRAGRSCSIYLPVLQMIPAKIKCPNSPDVFRYVCRELTLIKDPLKIIEKVKKSYLGYFGVKIGGQDKSRASQVIIQRFPSQVSTLAKWRIKLFQVWGINDMAGVNKLHK